MTKFDNSGSFSANKRKETDKHPDIKGRATVAGVDYWLSGWKKQGEDGTWYSLSFQPKDDEQPRRDKRNADADDDIPL